MRRTTLAWALWAAVALLALSGCGKVTADLTVHEDGSYDLTMVMAASEAELASVGQTPDSFTTLLTNQLAAQPGVEIFTVSDYHQDGYAGITITGTDIPGEDTTLFGRALVSTDDDGVRFDLQYPLTPVTPPQTVELHARVTFPGEVIDHNGALIDAATVEWTGDGTTALDLTATAEIGPTPDAGGGLPPVAVGAGALALVALVILIGIVRRHRARSAVPTRHA